TAGLLASAAFLIVAVEAFRRQADVGEGKDSPGGGFALVAESDLPVFQDLNSEKGREEIGDKLRQHYERGANPRTAEDWVNRDLALQKNTQVYAFRVQEGDDVSCLNLYEPKKPRLLGVPKALIDRGGFVFAESADPPDPWKALGRPGAPYAAF